MNSTTVGWVSDPNGRGTLSLIITCLVTLALCVWSAIHLNIPARDETSFNYLLRHIRWSLVGVFGPELVVWSAWRQYISARALRSEIRALGRMSSQGYYEQEKVGTGLLIVVTSFENIVLILIQRRTSSASQASSKYDWTMTHGFYAGMGGFVVDLDSSAILNADGVFLNCSRLTLTSRGVLLLAKCGFLPDISEKEILDKSKTDGFAKALACLQSGWMVVQVLARLRLELPITLLEVNTLGHVLCAFVIYILWWNKPRWIQEPTKLEGDWIRPLCAFTYMSSQISSSRQNQSGMLRKFYTRPELSALAYFVSSAKDAGSNNFHNMEAAPVVAQIDPSSMMAANPSEANSSTLFSTQEGKFYPRPPLSPSLEGRKDLEAASTSDQVSNPSPQQLIRWELAAEALRLYPEIRSRFVPLQDPVGKKISDALRLYPEMPKRFRRVPAKTSIISKEWLECPVEQLITESPGNWPTDDLLRGIAGLMMGMVLWFASIGFGGVHIAAWHVFFPSVIEAWLWRSSSIYISFSGLLWLSINFLAHASGTFWWYWYDLLTGDVHRFNYVVLGVLCTLGGVAYLFARAFLVVEAIISLRSLPLAAYSTPNWTFDIPHL